MKDSGSLTYPLLNNDGSRSEYGRRDNCIWQITAATPGKWLKLKVSYVDIEYDAHCGLDRVHIFKGQIPEKGFTSQLVKKNPEMRVARLCGGMNPVNFELIIIIFHQNFRIKIGEMAQCDTGIISTMLRQH